MSREVEASGASRVLLVAPTRRDAQVTCSLLNSAGIDCVPCKDLQALNRELATGAGAVMLTEAALSDPAMQDVLKTLQAQPSWSDVPTIVLSKERDRSLTATSTLTTLTNVTLLDFPSSTRTMVSAVQSALRARHRQYQIRDQLVEQQRAEAALRDADVRKDEFLATLAHELRNPLAAIRTGLQVLGRSADAEPQSARVLTMMARQSGTLVKLVDDLLEVSRIATGKVVLDRKLLDLRALIESGLETGQGVLDASRHDFRVELPDGPVWVHADAVRLIQVIGNLVNNAAKYTPDGGRITVAVAEEGSEAVVRVSDSGVGIPASMLPKVFDMFTQVNRTLDRAQGGLGIGLALVQQLLGLHGGRVEAASAGVDRGSTFTVRLPLAPANLLPPSVPRAPQPEPASAARLRFLVVDDNPDVGDVLALLLDDMGYETRTEYSGAAGLRTARDFMPDVVFCDLGMPGMGGCEVASRLRGDARFASTLLVALTGWGGDDDKRKTREAGFDLHLTKPIGSDDLQHVLNRVASTVDFTAVGR